MDLSKLNFPQLKLSVTGTLNNASKVCLGEVAPEVGAYLDEFKLFLAHFNTIPNSIQEIDIDCKKANSWFAENYKEHIKDLHYNKRYFRRSKSVDYDDIFYILFDDLIVNFDTNRKTVRFLFRQTDIIRIEEIIIEIKKFKQKKEKRTPEISLLVCTKQGFSILAFPIVKPKLNVEDNYNDDFKDIHKNIVKRLSTKDDKGLVLLHGKPGTGKTSYIRYLISVLKKNVIFLPPNLSGAMTDPNLMPILIENANSIFVIEDAENIIIDRERDGRSPVSALLNISDGLLSDFLNIQVICSFNTDISKIDSALMRKGRLIAKYEFKELVVEKAQALSDKLKFDTKIYKPMTLTEIYNQHEPGFEQTQQRNAIGFTAKNN